VQFNQLCWLIWRISFYRHDDNEMIVMVSGEHARLIWALLYCADAREERMIRQFMFEKVA
jgi:hypothetical protein